MRLILLKVI